MKTINDYAELVKEKHALNKTIAPVETDLTDASRGYHIGEQFIIDGDLFKAKTEIAQHDALVLNTNYEPADNLTEQIKNAGGGTGTDPRLDVFENNIAPVETDETDASRPYQVGEQLILNNILYDVIAPISEHDVITTTGSGANIAPADPISSKVQTLTKELGDEAATRSALGAKNLLPFDLDAIKELNTAGTWAGNVYTYRGVDFTVNPDGTILADGQATGGNASIKVFAATSSYEMLGKNVILNGCPSGGSATTYRIQAYRMGSVDGSSGTYFDDGDGTVAFDALNNASGTVGSFAVAVYENYDADNLLFKPMVRLSTDSDGTYQPYAKTNKELTDDVSSLNSAITNEVETRAKLGAHNLIPNNAVSTTNNDVTYTVNADGSVTANGTASGNSVFQFLASDEFFENNFVDGEKYILSGCPSGGGDSTYCIQTFRTPTAFDYGDGVEFTYHSAGTGKLVQIVVFDGVTVSNLTFYPMIRLASDPSTTYTPYAKTNRKLTEDSVSWDDFSELGAVNLARYSNDAVTSSGVKYTVSDGVININRESTSSGNSYFNESDYFTLKAGTYHFSNGYSSDNGWGYGYLVDRNSSNVAFDNVGGLDFTLSADTDVKYVIWVKPSGNPSNEKFYPMICLTSYNGDWQPPAKTNRELTEDVQYSQKDYTSTDYGIGLSLSKVGRIVIGQVIGQLSQAIANNVEPIQLPSAAYPSPYPFFFWITDQNELDSHSGTVQTMYKGYIKADGKLVVGAMPSGAKTRSQIFSYVAANKDPLT